jgi:indolepyruvate ferredoxin oxidoreductase beta subunit
VLIDGERLARAAGSARAANMALIGAASPMLPLKPETIEKCIAARFASKGQAVVDMNLKAFHAGREAAA